jgi:hypothetical protein
VVIKAQQLLAPECVHAAAAKALEGNQDKREGRSFGTAGKDDAGHNFVSSIRVCDAMIQLISDSPWNNPELAVQIPFIWRKNSV